MGLDIGEAAVEQLGAADRHGLGDIDILAAAIIAPDSSSAYLLVMTEPWASSTARDTMFSEAISSISCWRPSSFLIAPAMSGSLSASSLEKKPGNGPVCRMSCCTVMDV